MVVLARRGGLGALHVVLPISIAVAAPAGDRRSPRTGRPSAPTRRAAARTSSRARTSARSRASSPPRRCSSTTCSRSPCRSRAGVLRDHVRGPLAATTTTPSSRSARVLLIMVVNLRGVRESGLLFALPTYLFVIAIASLADRDRARRAARPAPPTARSRRMPLPPARATVTLFVLLRAFASGSTALTGVEAIANGVNAFRHPHGRRTQRGPSRSSGRSRSRSSSASRISRCISHARPSSTDSVVSQIARAVFPAGSSGAFMY